MEINVSNEKFDLCTAMCHDATNFTTECDIIVPDSKPDIGRILQMSARSKITGCETRNDSVIVSGFVMFNILYLADNEEKSVCAINSSCGFSNLFKHEGIKEGMLTVSDVEVTELNYNAANCRKLTAKAVLSGKVCTYSSREISPVTEITGACTQKKTISSTVVRAFAEGTATANDSFELPDGKTQIKEILKSDAIISDSDIKIIDDKAIIKGTAEIVILYSCENGIDYFKTEIPFAHVMDAFGIRSDMLCDYDIKVVGLTAETSQDINGQNRITDIEAELFFRVIARETIFCRCVTDAFLPKGTLDLQSENLTVSSVENTVHNEINYREIVTLPENTAPIETVYEIIARPYAENCEIVGDKLKISGYTEVYILYLSSDSSAPVYSYKANVDFSVMTDSPDCTLKPVAVCKSKNISYVINGERSIEIRGMLKINTQCIREASTSIIHSAQIGETAPLKRPSIVVSYVNDGRNLWDISKEYRVACEDILSANALECEDDITGGMALIIPK